MSNDNEYIERRKEKIKSLRDMGLDPFSNTYVRENSVKDILQKYSGTNPKSFSLRIALFKSVICLINFICNNRINK